MDDFSIFFLQTLSEKKYSVQLLMPVFVKFRCWRKDFFGWRNYILAEMRIWVGWTWRKQPIYLIKTITTDMPKAEWVTRQTVYQCLVQFLGHYKNYSLVTSQLLWLLSLQLALSCRFSDVNCELYSYPSTSNHYLSWWLSSHDTNNGHVT